ncbi:MAG TPA: hypothetical protein QGH10_17675 [Armatimonadota bacterium]|nr:hypothetical protein [Armatimonadota bacterium]
MRGVCLLALAITSTPALRAQDRPLATSIAWHELWQAGDAARLPIVHEPSRLTIAIPHVEAPDNTVLCLRFRARLHYAHPAGWNNYLALLIDEEPVGRMSEDGWPRVLNRQLIFATTHTNYPEVELVENRSGFPCLQVFFGPEDPDLAGDVLTDVEEGYWYLVDVDDLMDGDEEHELTLVNTALAKFWNDDLPEGMELVVEDLALGAVPESEVDGLRGASYAKRARSRGRLLPGGPETVRVAPAGGLQVESGDEVWFVESSFSYPQEPAMGLNHLTCLREVDGEDGWRPKATVKAGNTTVKASGQAYRLERRVTRAAGRIEVADSVTNLTDDVLGMSVKHSIISPEPPLSARLNGLEAAAHASGRFPEQPTVFAAQRDSGLGAVAEDNALRLQMGTRALVNETSFRTDQLGIAPGETYTMRWALYPGSVDYWDFINAVRRDWDVNYTVDGPFDFFDIRQLDTDAGRQAARRLLERKHLKLFALVPWFEYYNGWPYTRDEYREMMTEAMAFLREIVPDAVFLSCIETNLVPVPLTFFGDSIPEEGWLIGRDNGGEYRQPAAPGMTAHIDASPWRDSVVRQADGTALLDCWYVSHYKEPPALNLMVYPETGNHRHAHMLEQMGWLLDEVGFDGVYIDQFSLAFSVASDRHTRERWDGRTVRLDPAGNVTEQIADVGLISAEARAEWVKFGLDRGKTVVANSHPVANELQSLRSFRFMETQGYDPLTTNGPPEHWPMAKGQLHSPIGLGHSFPNTAGADFFMRTLITHLRYGLLYYCYSTNFPSEGERGGEFGPLNHMFPFTPVELHEGWILGEERLITCVSGSFPWPHSAEPEVMLFDSRGRERDAEARIEARGDAYTVEVSLDDWWEVAVIVPKVAE